MSSDMSCCSGSSIWIISSSAVLITSTEEGGFVGDYDEPAPDLTMKKFLASLAGHVAGYMASIS